MEKTAGVVGVLLFAILAACGGQTLPAGQAPPPTVETQSETASDVESPESESPEPESAEPESPEPESPEPTPTATAAPEAAEPAGAMATAETWVDATGNLVGLESECGTVHYVSAHPFSNELFVGIAANGTFRLDEESQDWVPLGTNTASDQVDHRLAWIEYEPNDPDRFWQAGIYGQGVFRTDDGGATFSQQGDIRHVDYVSTDPTDPDRALMLAGAHEDRILYLSRDGGTTWEDIADTLPEAIGFTTYPVVIDSSTFVLGTFRSDDAGIFLTNDGGLTWTTAFSGAVSGPPLVDGANIYWLARGGGLIVSNDGGQTFELRPGRIGGQPTTLSLLEDGRLLTHGDSTALISDDEGESWTAAGPPLPFNAPTGIVMSSDESAIYAWKFSCSSPADGDSVLAESIVRLDLG